MSRVRGCKANYQIRIFRKKKNGNTLSKSKCSGDDNAGVGAESLDRGTDVTGSTVARACQLCGTGFGENASRRAPRRAQSWGAVARAGRAGLRQSPHSSTPRLITRRGKTPWRAEPRSADLWKRVEAGGTRVGAPTERVGLQWLSRFPYCRLNQDGPVDVSLTGYAGRDGNLKRQQPVLDGLGAFCSWLFVGEGAGVLMFHP